MSIWRKVASLLFDESEADVIVEDEMEDISFPEEEPVKVKYKKPESVAPKKESVQQPNEETPHHAFKPIQTQTQNQNQNQMQKPKMSKEDSKRFVSIEVEEQRPKRHEFKHVARNTARPTRVNLGHEEKIDFEVTPVISPIFGSKDKNTNAKASSSGNITLPKKKRTNPLGTIISPYYGIGELEEFEEKAQESIQMKEMKLQEEPPVEEVVEYVVEEDVNSIPLDDLLVENDQDEEDDMMQISLFGDSTPLRDSDHDAILHDSILSKKDVEV